MFICKSTLITVSALSVVYTVATVRKKNIQKTMFPQDQGDVKELLIGQEYLTITGKSGNDGNGSLQNYDYSTQGKGYTSGKENHT